MKIAVHLFLIAFAFSSVSCSFFSKSEERVGFSELGHAESGSPFQGLMLGAMLGHTHGDVIGKQQANSARVNRLSAEERKARLEAAKWSEDLANERRKSLKGSLTNPSVDTGPRSAL